MTKPVLAARGLSRRINGRAILTDVSVDIYAGERVAVVGPSGSGKTTLLALLAGLVPPTTGDVIRDIPASAPDPPRRSDVAIVLQGYGLIGLLTAAENVEIALRASGRRPAEAMEVAADILGQLGLGRFAMHLVDELSGGQRQRVAVARALALAPWVLLADEPTAEQDADNEELLLERLLPPPAADGRAVVVATHDPDVAARCDRTIELTDGRLATPVSRVTP